MALATCSWVRPLSCRAARSSFLRRRRCINGLALSPTGIPLTAAASAHPRGRRPADSCRSIGGSCKFCASLSSAPLASWELRNYTACRAPAGTLRRAGRGRARKVILAAGLRYAGRRRTNANPTRRYASRSNEPSILTPVTLTFPGGHVDRRYSRRDQLNREEPWSRSSSPWVCC